MRSAPLILAFTLSGLIGAEARAAAPSRALLDRIDAAARETSTLSADFTQKNRMKLFKQELSSTGRLLFRAPRQIRWEYLAPDPSVLVLDGTKATMSSPGAAPQVFDLAKDATMRAIFDQLLTFVGGGSIASVQADYELAASGPETRPLLTLTPKPTSPVAKAFVKIELQLDDKLLVRKILLVEKNGDEKEIVLGKIGRNGKLPDGAFDSATK